MTGRTILLGLVAAGAVAAANPSFAQERPRYVPSSDVAVTYHVNSADKNVPQEVHANFEAGPQKLRIEGDRGVILVDVRAEKATMLFPQQQMALELPNGGGMVRNFMLNDRTKFTRRGTETVAGVRCTDWDVTTDRGHGSACLTDDGVLLKGQGADQQGRGGSIEAITVSYGAQPAALFEAPAGFKHVEIPRGLGAAMAGQSQPGR